MMIHIFLLISSSGRIMSLTGSNEEANNALNAVSMIARATKTATAPIHTFLFMAPPEKEVNEIVN
jgi:hypothetical protein